MLKYKCCVCVFDRLRAATPTDTLARRESTCASLTLKLDAVLRTLTLTQSSFCSFVTVYWTSDRHCPSVCQHNSLSVGDDSRVANKNTWCHQIAKGRGRSCTPRYRIWSVAYLGFDFRSAGTVLGSGQQSSFPPAMGCWELSPAESRTEPRPPDISPSVLSAVDGFWYTLQSF